MVSLLSLTGKKKTIEYPGNSISGGHAHPIIKGKIITGLTEMGAYSWGRGRKKLSHRTSEFAKKGDISRASLFSRESVQETEKNLSPGRTIEEINQSTGHQAFSDAKRTSHLGAQSTRRLDLARHKGTQSDSYTLRENPGKNLKLAQRKIRTHHEKQRQRLTEGRMPKGKKSGDVASSRNGYFRKG